MGMLQQTDEEGGGKGLEGGTLKDSWGLNERLKMVKTVSLYSHHHSLLNAKRNLLDP